MRKTMTTRWLLGILLVVPGLTSGQETPAPAEPRAAASSTEQEMRAGLSSYLRRHFSEAERHFRAAVDADPGSAAAHYYLGYTIYKIAEPKRPNDPGKQRAAEEFAKAYAIDPAFQPGWGRPRR